MMMLDSPTLQATQPKTFCDVLEWRATTHPHRLAFRFLNDGAHESASLTFGHLYQKARSVAALIQRQAQPGDRAILLYPPGLDFIVAFLGCLLAGVIAVPLPLPRLNKANVRLESAVKNARPRFILTTQDIRLKLREKVFGFSYLAGLVFLETDSDVRSELVYSKPQITKEDIAFLQYTSGSTSTPRGVMVTHENLLANVEMIRRRFGWHADTVMVSWLPQFHDMGLIGNSLTPIYVGFTCIQMPPVAFIQHPIRWLRTVSRYHATCIGGPDFGYDYCCRRITSEPLTGLDLSNLEWAYSGSEPVRIETINRFTQIFQSHGFKKEAFYPCYGLAEATLFVSGGEKAALPVTACVSRVGLEARRVRAPENAQDVHTVVGCGKAVTPEHLVIVDPETGQPCPPDCIGEIMVRGPHISQGYWENIEKSLTTFVLHQVGKEMVPHLRTGDLGFLQQGELFVVGRMKDVMIIRGRNFYPQDFELAAQRAHPALHAGRGAAFTVEQPNGPQLIMVQELLREHRQVNASLVIENIREAIATAYNIRVDKILLIKQGSIPLTTSGKVQRHACRTAMIKSELKLWSSP